MGRARAFVGLREATAKREPAPRPRLHRRLEFLAKPLASKGSIGSESGINVILAAKVGSKTGWPQNPPFFRGVIPVKIFYGRQCCITMDAAAAAWRVGPNHDSRRRRSSPCQGAIRCRQDLCSPAAPEGSREWGLPDRILTLASQSLALGVTGFLRGQPMTQPKGTRSLVCQWNLCHRSCRYKRVCSAKCQGQRPDLRRAVPGWGRGPGRCG